MKRGFFVVIDEAIVLVSFILLLHLIYMLEVLGLCIVCSVMLYVLRWQDFSVKKLSTFLCHFTTILA